MMDEECYALPKYTSESAEVQEACDTMNQYCKASVTYTMEDENVVVDKELISTWLKYDDNMQVSLDEDAVRACESSGRNMTPWARQDRSRHPPEKRSTSQAEPTDGPWMRILRQRH